MRNLTTLFFSTFLITSFLVGQDRFEAFRSLEERVKYSAPDSLHFFAQKVDTNDTFGKALFHWSKGKGLYWNSEYPNAYVELENASKFVKKLDDDVLLAEIYLDLSASLAVVDKNGRALSFLLNANELIKEKGTMEQKTRIAISLAEMYRKVAEYEESLKVLRETLPKTKGLNYNKARCLNRMAAVFSETAKHDSSLNYSYRALEIAEGLGDPDLIAVSENEIGFIFRQQDKFQASLPHFYKADSLWRSVGMLRYAVNPMHHIAVVFRSMNAFHKGLNHSRKAYSMIKGKGWYQIEMNLLDDLKMYHIHLGNKDSVLFYDRERLQAAINFRSDQYEVNTKMVEILFAQKENEQTIREQEVQLKNELLEKEAIIRERTTLWIIVSLIVIILLIIFIYAINQRKLKKKLVQENKKSEKKNEQLLIALGANEALVQEISHRVKNNLAVLAGLLTMQANRSDSEKVKKELTDSVLRIDSIATIHKKLYDKRSDAKVNLKEAIIDLSRNVTSAMGKNPDEVLKTHLDEVEIDIAEAVTLCLIVNEALTNSCKYADVSAENKVILSVRKTDDNLKCCIIDHGPGFEESDLSTKSKSLGVYLIKLLAKQLGARIKWEKTEDQFSLCIEMENDG